MKRHKVLVALLVVFLIGAMAQAQSRTSSPQGQQDVLLQLLPLLQQAQQRGGGRGAALGGAWWTNTALVTRLGLTDDQKLKIERAFENHREKIASSTQLLDKEEAQLARLLEAEPLDRNAVLTQTDHVIQARGELERANSAMTLEMRESLTRAQWMQLPQTSVGLNFTRSPVRVPIPPGAAGGPGQRGGPRGGAAQDTSPPPPPPPPPAPGASANRIRVGEKVAQNNLIQKVNPVYPPLAKQARIQGVVVLEAGITKEGKVDNLKVVTGNPLLIQAAIDSVKQWVYQPVRLNGAAVDFVTTITVNFVQ